MLQKYFSTATTPLSPVDLFPQEEVYSIIQVGTAPSEKLSIGFKEIMSSEEHHFAYVNQLFSLLDKLTQLDNKLITTETQSMDLSLISWVLLLLSNTITLNS